MAAMHYSSIKAHLKPYGIIARRATTIHHALAAAIAPHDDYDDQSVRDAIELLGQDPDPDLRCVYCDAVAQTWDHVFATVKNTKFSGHGHRLGSLVPCCKPCNSEKGNKAWDAFLQARGPQNKNRIDVIAHYLAGYEVADHIPSYVPEYAELEQVK